ncbi:MAG: proteasome-type protease [Acidimicrobiales bacterium]|nr:proteasome-type protease [Acidimicrobiales bacterium]
MTYGVGMRLDRGLVFMADTRTNSGVDNVSSYRKLFRWQKPGERAIVLLAAGNLGTSQAVVSLLDERSKAPEDRKPSILEAPTMFQVARLVGQTLSEVIAGHADEGPEAESTFNSTLIVGGQIAGMEPRLFMVYPEGNFIEASEETPFLQIGETKYGKPILVRAYRRDMRFEDAVKLLMVSFDSTLKSNLSVGMPLDLLVYEDESLTLAEPMRIEQDDPYFRTISSGWGAALTGAFDSLPDFTF